MGKYPLEENVAPFLESRNGCITDITKRNIERRLKRIIGEMKTMYDQGKIGSMAPSKMKPEDVRVFILSRIDRGVSPDDIAHDISALDQLLQYSGSAIVRQCLVQYPGLKPRRSQSRKSPLPMTAYEQILAEYERSDKNDFKSVRAFCMVLMYICTGARNKELRLAGVSDLDLEKWTIYFAHVKGEETWGEPRTVGIPEVIRPLVLNYLQIRSEWLVTHGGKSDSLFFSLNGTYTSMSSNSTRLIKKVIENKIGVHFEYRDCRRAFGQRLIDNNADIEDVSILMGHASTKTTEGYYARRRNTAALKNVQGLW
jgi:integrase/recombinase XerD